MLRRMCSRVCASAARWWLRAPQQPCAGSTPIPSRSSSLAAAALMPGANRGCTHPSNKSARRAWRGTGQTAGGVCSGMCRRRAWGTSGRMNWAARKSGRRRRGYGNTRHRRKRFSRSPSGLGLSRSMWVLPMSSRRAYSTPEGQAVSHARQPRQRSRWTWVVRPASCPSRRDLMR